SGSLDAGPARIGSAVLGIELQGLVMICDGAFKVAFGFLRPSTTHIGIRVLVVDFDSITIVGDGTVVIAVGFFVRGTGQVMTHAAFRFQHPCFVLAVKSDGEGTLVPLVIVILYTVATDQRPGLEPFLDVLRIPTL